MKATLLAILTAFVAVCGDPRPYAPPDEDRELEAPPPKQHFCCSEVKSGSGEDCSMIGKESINTCAGSGGAVLYCAGSWNLQDGVATCLD